MSFEGGRGDNLSGAPERDCLIYSIALCTLKTLHVLRVASDPGRCFRPEAPHVVRRTVAQHNTRTIM